MQSFLISDDIFDFLQETMGSLKIVYTAKGITMSIGNDVGPTI